MTSDLLKALPIAFVVCAAQAAGVPAAKAQAQIAPQQAARPAQDSALQAAIKKSNAYITLMNRTLRASDSWDRYRSWVNLQTGPTGKERYITYGLYSLYDVRSEIGKAREAIALAPSLPDVDATMARYIAAYEVLGPLLTQANGYYERKDYLADGAAEGRALHAKLVPAADAFLKERKLLDAQFRPFKIDLDRRELAAIEAVDGRAARYHVKNTMIGARQIVDLMPTNASPVVDMPAFDETLNRFATAVRELDTYAQANPGQLSSYESQPRSMLGKTRELREKLAKAKGDARRGAGNDVNDVTRDYNRMISSSEMALPRGR